MSAGNSAYSPLPQSNSDSDGSSEEELHVSRGNRILKRAAKVQNSTLEKGYNEQKNNVINYKPLDNNSDVGIALNKLRISPDEVSILKPEGSLEIFSTSRKIWFVLSLLLCVFTTVAFIWLLPCNVDSCPSASDLKKYNFTWEENLSNLEIYGPISLIPNNEENQNLIFLTSTHSDSKKNSSENGLMCLKGKDGSLEWKIKLEVEPTDIDCKVIDVDGNGITDCLVQGQNILRAINPTSGKELWDIQKHNKNIYFKNFPLIIPDLNNDGIKELLLSSCITGEVGKGFENYLIIISGKTGEILNNPLLIKQCSVVKDLMYDRSTLSFTCFNSDGKESVRKINLTELYKSLKNVLGIKNVKNWEKPSQHVRETALVHMNGFSLNLENRGECPEDCVVLVDVRNESDNSDNKTFFRFIGKNTFGMAPVVLKTKKEVGFVLKFWKWHLETEKSDFQNDVEFSLQKTVIVKNKSRNLIKRRSKKSNHVLNNSELLDNEMLSEGEWEYQRLKRTAARNRMIRSEKKDFDPGAFNLHVITESIVKIILNNSRLVVKNVTKDEIIQICRKPDFCQPNVYKQRHSVLVADFGQGEEKLITFSAKYVHDSKKSNKNSEDWFLQSRVRVLNL